MTDDPIEEFLAEVEKYRHRDASTIKLLALVRVYREVAQFGKEDVLMAANCIQCIKDGNEGEETWGKLRATRHTFFQLVKLSSAAEQKAKEIVQS